ncbi:MAG: 2-dehydro-3-deoxygalactonokinase [Rhodobacteraceae bacterium]|nr:2-dehydro-3-deoxygalactonokinase [Paracoccaceae bacterium]
MTETVMNPNWIAVDWGTTNLRIWQCDQAGNVLDETKVQMGMGALTASEYEGVLISHIDHHLSGKGITEVLVCGMAGARQGWQDAGYLTAPCNTPALNQAVTVPTADPRIMVRILPGIKQPDPADVMRGEETQIAGFLKQTPDYNGLICLPGTHSKWVHVQNGRVVVFQTFMTGEVYDLLSRNSVLKHSVSGECFSQSDFVDAAKSAFENPTDVSSQLFRLRAQHLVNDTDSTVLSARLSGILIGQEVAAMERQWNHLPITLIGEEALCSLYKSVLEAVGKSVDLNLSAAPTLLGLIAIRNGKG